MTGRSGGSRSSARPPSSCRAGCASRSSTSPSRASCSRTSGSPTSGVVPGHDLPALEKTFAQALELREPVIVHVRTQKGRGYRPAETDQVGFHGAALPPMTEEFASRANGANGGSSRRHHPVQDPEMADDATPAITHPDAPKKPPNYTAHFSAELIELARTDRRIVAITAGMPTGTGLNRFQAEYPDRFFDVGIAEQHAVAMATGLAMGGSRPVVAIYSTFLQRAFDQTVHDACQNDQPVLLAVDRSGLVGEDGTSHQGMFTLPAQRQIPHLVIASPKDEQELRSLLRTALAQDHPFALHYPRDPGFDVPPRDPTILPIGRGEVIRDGSDVLVVGFGPIVARGLAAAEALAADGWSVEVVNARFAKPLDRELLLDRIRGKQLVVTLEESVVSGGFGSAVLELLEEARFADPAYRDVPLKIVGLPADRFIDHGSVSDLRRLLRIDAAGIEAQIRETLEALGLWSPAASPRRPAIIREA